MALKEIRDTKIEKVNKLREMGINPYPSNSNRTHSVLEALESFDSLSSDGDTIVIAGRMMAKRGHGGAAFFDINDGGHKIQAHIKEDVIGEEGFKMFSEFCDIGDIIEVTGPLFRTKKEERTVEAQKIVILSKALLPLPEKWHGLVDVEERFRKRYLDILLNDETRAKMNFRFRILEATRDFFRSQNFLEVETPMLQPIPGGTMAKPFKTHMNDLDLDLYLRIAPELYLKRLLVAGFERVFEMGKNFRNEGMDREHNPEFVMLEAYASYKDYEWLMSMVEEFMPFVAQQVFGRTEIIYNEKTINLKGPYKRIEFKQIIKDHSGLDYDSDDVNAFAKKAKALGVTIDKAMTKGNIADEIFKKTARPFIVDPVFIINHPLELSPLSKKIDGQDEYVARFQLLVAGFELMNAFSELNDPIDQRERFESQEKMRLSGNAEAHHFDEEFVEALEYAMPPAAGIGIGIDRLIALLTDSHSLREILPFPTMKPKN